MKQITLEDIIAKKDAIKEDKVKKVKIFVESLDGYVTMKKPGRKLIADSLEKENGIESNIHVVYNSMVEPNLKDLEAQKAFGVHTPKDLLVEILNDGEISLIAEQLMNASGYSKNTVRVVTDEVKN